MMQYSSILMHSLLGRGIIPFLFLHPSTPLELNYLNSSSLIFEKNLKERTAQRISHPEQFGLTHGKRDATARV